jgi:serine/threonine-protein kinase RsbW
METTTQDETTEIGPDGPPYLELQNIAVATWETRNAIISGLCEAVNSGGVQMESVSSSWDNVKEVQKKLVDAMLQILDPDKTQEFAIRWIAEEMCVNSGKTHGNKLDPSKLLQAMYGLDLASSTAMIYIGDQGPGFNPREIPDPTASMSRLEKGSGRGIQTMDILQVPAFEGAQAMFLPMQEGSELCREFVYIIPVAGKDE